MQNDQLQAFLADIQQECQKRNITLFTGKLDTSSRPVVFFTQDTETQWTAFLDTFQKAGAKILILSARVNDTGPWAETEDPRLTPQENEEARKDSKLLNETKGFLAYFALSYFEDGACFQYEKWADWALPYEAVFREENDEFSDYLLIEGKPL